MTLRASLVGLPGGVGLRENELAVDIEPHDRVAGMNDLTILHTSWLMSV